MGKYKINELEYNLENLVEFTIFWFQNLKEKYGKEFIELIKKVLKK